MIKKIFFYLFLVSFSLKSMNLEEALRRSAFSPEASNQDFTSVEEKPLPSRNLSKKKGSIRKAKSANDIGTVSQEPKRNSLFDRFLVSAASFFGRNSRNNNDKEKEMVIIQNRESAQSDDN